MMTGLSSRLSPVAELLGRVTQHDDMVTAINQLGAQLDKPRVIDSLMQYEEMLYSLLDALRERGVLDEKDYHALREMHDETVSVVESESKVDVGTKEPRVKTHLEALSFLGGLTYDRFDKSLSLFIGPRMLTNSLAFAALMDPLSRRKHVSAIAKIRAQPLPASPPDIDQNVVAPFCDQLRSALASSAIGLVPGYPPPAALQRVSVEYPPSASLHKSGSEGLRPYSP